MLSDLSLSVQTGEFVAITGESGSGKTTLLSILGTLLSPDEGQYSIDGQQVSSLSLPKVRNELIGIVFQDHRLLPQFNALQNILLPLLAFHDTCPPEAEEYALSLMRFMGIEELRDKPVHVLSGGEKTRVAICRALINRPAVLLADEPTGQLDQDNSSVVAQLFKRINEELHTTIIMVTHSPSMAQVAHTCYHLSQGKLV